MAAGGSRNGTLDVHSAGFVRGAIAVRRERSSEGRRTPWLKSMKLKEQLLVKVNFL